MSSFFITLQLGIFQFFFPSKLQIKNIIPFSCGLISLFFSFLVFFYSIINIKWPNRGLFNLEDPNSVFAKCKDSYPDCLRGLIYTFHQKTKENINTDNVIGKKIRNINILLILSLFFLILSALIFYLFHLNLIP